MKVLIIIPAFNEAGNLKGVVESLQQENRNWDIVVVDDASTDNTNFIARELEAIRVITLPYNLGIGGCVQTGIKFAKKYDYDVVVQFDGDGQHRASDVSKIIDSFKNLDFLIGSRFLDKADRRGNRSTFIRRIGIKTFRILIRILMKKRITDATSGLRIFGKQAINLLVDYYPQDYPEPETVVYLLKNGLSAGEVQVQMNDRKYGKSSISPFESIYYMVKVIVSILFSKIRRY